MRHSNVVLLFVINCNYGTNFVDTSTYIKIIRVRIEHELYYVLCQGAHKLSKHESCCIQVITGMLLGVDGQVPCLLSSAEVYIFFAKLAQIWHIHDLVYFGL